jgi:hypothetical protein
MATPQKTAARGAPAAKPAAKPAAQPTKPAAQAAKPAPAAAAKPSTPAAPAPKPAGVEAGTAVVERQTTAVASMKDVPEHIRGSAGRGSENVETQDLIIPRIELVQALSKCLEEGSAEYIEGAKAGMFYNSVTRELYGHSLIVCPVFFKKQYLAWRDRKKGGGFGGAFDTAQECHDRISQEDNIDEWEAIETAQQIVLVVNPETHETTEAVLSCARTKQKVSRQWNSLIRVNGFDRFSRIYELFGVDETNAQNQTYKNIGVRYIDFASVPVYKAAEELYNSIAGGTRAVKIDDNYDDSVIDGAVDSGAPGSQPGDPGASTEY